MCDFKVRYTCIPAHNVLSILYLENLIVNPKTLSIPMFFVY